MASLKSPAEGTGVCNSLKTVVCAGGSGETGSCDKKAIIIPKRRQDLVKWNGWGYKDSRFFVTEDENGSFTGNRYSISGHVMPYLKDHMIDTLSVDLAHRVPTQQETQSAYDSVQIRNEEFLSDVKKTSISRSEEVNDRLFRAHGHLLNEMYILRTGIFERIPDLVLWPVNHDQVVNIVQLANKHNVVIIPFGGGTSVTGALSSPPEEKRMIVSLDTSQMNKVLWIDFNNMTMRAQSGITGQELERQLAEKGMCTGHEPDSMEFSTLGGWVSTRASGMKKNIYGNIEDMLVNVKVVTAKGTVEKTNQVMRVSSGVDINHIILGSEGTMGVITEVTLKVRHLPESKKYGSIVFPDFESGVKFMWEVTRKKLTPASIRLLDNLQFRTGNAMKVENNSIVEDFKDSMKRLYVTKLKGFDPSKMVVATILFEGTKQSITALEKQLYRIASSHGGIEGGEESGERAYVMTYVVAYARDMALDYYVLAESFETAVPWDRCVDLCNNVKDRLHRESKEAKLPFPPHVSCRVTQTYTEGCCIYFYFAFNYRGLKNPVEVFERLEGYARDEIMANGGSISHHHGIGKVRKRWLHKSVGNVGVGSMQAIKKYLDPKNIFANGNLMDGLKTEDETIQEESDDFQFSSKL